MTKPAVRSTHFSTAFVREGLAAGFLVGAVLILATHYSHLPANIPSPFNRGGDEHGMGGRSQLWLLLFLGGWIFFLASLINFLPVGALDARKPLSASEQRSRLAACKAFLGWFKVTVMAGLAFWIYRVTR